MKRRITTEQLMELTKEQQYKLRDMWEPQFGDIYYMVNVHGVIGTRPMILDTQRTDELQNKDYRLPALDIGQMINILIQYNGNEYPVFRTDARAYISVEFTNEMVICSDYNEELSDSLWAAVKQIL